MLEAPGRARADGEDLVVAPTDCVHFGLGDRRIVQRRGPVGAPLEYRQLRGLLGDLRDELDRRRAGTHHGDALATEVDGVVRPVEGVE